MPQSSTTGRVRDGWMPAHRVARTSLAIDIKIEPTPVCPLEIAAAEKITRHALVTNTQNLAFWVNLSCQRLGLVHSRHHQPLPRQSPQYSQYPSGIPIETARRIPVADREY